MFKIIQDLKRADGKGRQKLLMRTHAKNVEYLKRKNPELADFVVQRGTGPFGINVGDTQLDVFDRATGALYHPPGQLLQYMADLGSWHHTGWVDKLSIEHVFRGQESVHAKMIIGLLEKLYVAMPALRQRMASGTVKLPALPDGRRYSGPVVFLGIFTGLHIMHYLNRTVARDVFLIEPDLDRFALSCYFVDYEEMDRMCGRLLMHVGPNAPQSPIEHLITGAPVTASSWVRLLPAYPAGQFDDIINRVSLRWRSLTEVFVPYDRELNNLKYGMRNIQSKLPFPHTPPKLSPNCTIAVVASGPSLNKDMEWLRKNQDRLIIMASISCMRVLKENGIRVDFQCTLDTEIDEPLFQQLQLDPDVILAAYYKLAPELAARFKKVILIPEDGKANCVRFLKSFTYTHPTTGNLATAFAAWCRPSRLLLVGLDLGFREGRRSHVEGGWHDENEGIGHDEEVGGRDHIQVTANFPESEGEISTIAYYNNARFNVEDAVKALRGACEVLNLADGARVSGAEPRRSADLELPEYPEKAADIAAILGAFSSDYEGILEPYTTPGGQVIREMVDSIAAAIEQKDGFRWPEFAKGVDLAWMKALGDILGKYPGELRIEVFGKLIHDLLANWYRAMILTETIEEAEQLYRKGLEEVRAQLGSEVWPEELDQFPGDPVEAPAQPVRAQA